MALLRKILLGGELDPEVVAAAERSGFVTVDDPLRQYSSFFLRLVVATVIATAGIAADSATTIIGAMLVAPLMSPMLGSALATAVGRPRRTLATFVLTVCGMAVVFAVSIGVTAIIPVDVDMSTNSQVLARTSPRLVDLIIALAAGFMAALASMRRDIPDAVPGIAISASIVPPLCVVGAAFYEGAPAAALGAFLLFVTNYVAIQIAGAAVYLLAGLGTRAFSVMEGKAREMWYLTVAFAAVVITLLLGASSMGVIHENDQLRRVQDIVSAWAGDSDYRVARFEFVDGVLRIEIAGSGNVPDAEELDGDLIDAGVEIRELSLAVVEEHRIVH
ncbi:DUF389 domain-containing protein [Enorma burkinafasonensis]|uniref:DUF389 domain-containing protein n=1 Tax=Enorma burkinafasonensis TaxID=2590867 RepID=UPI0026EC713C|nr:DUF389 domain-containing protein [Enorma burkinafasonensis]MCI7731426.1 DUF389 domain-containing protein [Enorma burkinafasonensis]